MENSTSKMIIKSEIKNINAVMHWIESEIKALFEVRSKFNNFKLCVQEAVTNAIIHGNLSDKKKSVVVSYSINDSLSLKVEDEGSGISLENQIYDTSTITKEDVYKESGRGIMIIKHFCDEVIFDNKSITLIMGYK